MSHSPQEAALRAAIGATEAQLFVADIKASCAFYVAKLGFTCVFTYGDPPFYAHVRRDGGRLNLRCVEEPLVDPALRAREVFLSATLTVESRAETEALYAEFKAAGVALAQELCQEAWGAWTFIVKDPDGNLLLFAGRDR